jgi:plasmid stabilization system protein ParE
MASHALPLIQLSAYEDIAAIADRLECYAGEAAADRVADEILARIDLLATIPYLGSLHQDPVLASSGYRKLVVGRYVVIYRVYDGRATVVRVFHGSTNYVPKMDA